MKLQYFSKIFVNPNYIYIFVNWKTSLLLRFQVMKDLNDHFFLNFLLKCKSYNIFRKQTPLKVRARVANIKVT